MKKVFAQKRVGLPQKALKQVSDIQRNACTLYIPSSLCCVTAQSEIGM